MYSGRFTVFNEKRKKRSKKRKEVTSSISEKLRKRIRLEKILLQNPEYQYVRSTVTIPLEYRSMFYGRSHYHYSFSRYKTPASSTSSDKTPEHITVRNKFSFPLLH